MVREFKIQNNIYDASFGLASGTVMNLITQSGTDAIHGSAWEFVRNSAMDAIGYFAIAKPALSRNQFGGVIGGPIVKNKIFYFGGYEGLRLTQGEVSPSVVPTAAEKTGDFSSFLTGTTANLCASSGSAAPLTSISTRANCSIRVLNTTTHVQLTRPTRVPDRQPFWLARQSRGIS